MGELSFNAFSFMVMDRKNYFKYFTADDQLRPELEKSLLAGLDNWDLAWEILEPINIATTKRSEIGLSKRLSAGQKTLYFFWYLDAEVENGGFIQFYFNKTDYYLPSILEGLKFIGDEEMLQLVSEAEELYQKDAKSFNRTKTTEGFSKLYAKIPEFENLDDRYYELRDKTIALIVAYFRRSPGEFVKLR